MLTAKENLRQTIIPGGKPDRFVNNYEGVYLMFHPQLAHSGGMLQPGLHVDEFGRGDQIMVVNAGLTVYARV